MTPHVIVSYDDTSSDHDALRLGRVFHELGARLTLAYVRHAAEQTIERELAVEQQARDLLARGAAVLEDPYVEQRVVMSPSTGEGLGTLAGEIGAEMIVFGSEYRTPEGRVGMAHSAQTLLENGPAAIAFAPAGYDGRDLSIIGILPGTADEAARATARSIAARFDASVVDSARGVDLLIVGSRPEARTGRTMISAAAANAIDEATAPVLILARDAALSFETLVTA
jgi:nucleotide-binding universal stress UspA family protein